MIGTLIGDLAAWTWKNDYTQFYPKLISEKAEKSVYTDILISTAETLMENPSISGTAFIEIQKDCAAPKENHAACCVLRAVVIGWLYDTPGAIEQAIETYGQCEEKEELYAANYMARLIHSLRYGATKNEAAQVEFCGKFRAYTKETHWQTHDGILGCLVRAWMSFYDAFDYGSAIHNAVKQPGDIALNCSLTGALADAMYGCGYYFVKSQYQGGGPLEWPAYLGRKYYILSRTKRIFFPKNNAMINVDRHSWKSIQCSFSDKIIDQELHRRILKAFYPSWDYRYGLYLEDGWVYVYRSFRVVGRFKLEKQPDGTYRIKAFQASDEFEDYDMADIALRETMHTVEYGWELVSDNE